MRRSVRWPKAPNALGNALRRMASNLRAAGIEIQFSRVERLRLARQFAQIVAIQDSPSAEAHPRMSDTLVHADQANFSDSDVRRGAQPPTQTRERALSANDSLWRFVQFRLAARSAKIWPKRAFRRALYGHRTCARVQGLA